MRSLTFARALVLSALLVTIVVVAGLAIFWHRARTDIVTASDRSRRAAASRVEARISAELAGAERALDHLDTSLAAGALDADDPRAVEAALYGSIADEPKLCEATFTRAVRSEGIDDDHTTYAPEKTWQVSVFRAANLGLTTFVTRPGDGGFVTFERVRPPSGVFDEPDPRRRGSREDPTKDPTFFVIARPSLEGRTVWSDIHRAEIDADLPEEKRRIVVSVQKAIDDRSGAFVGVARVAILADVLDQVSGMRADEGDPDDPSRIFLLAATPGPPTVLRDVARLAPDDGARVFGDDLRFVPAHPPPELTALLASPIVSSLDPIHPNGLGEVDVGAVRYDATLREISIAGSRSGLTGWTVAVIAPESHYTRELEGFRDTFLVAFGVTLALVIGVGAATLVAVRGGLRKVVALTGKMRRFEFGPSGASSAFREVTEVIDGLERAKTVVRAMQKYVPLDLVRTLYEENRDPALGGELRDVTLMFTDIEGFTTLAEKLPPDELARRLGDYLEAMTNAIEATGGTIDKYIGDAVMSFWNAPKPVAEHAKAACAAVLSCMKANEALYASAPWKGLPPLVTRYGVHEAEVMVGHFGAPTRLAYTALGDGVNLAARLEPLCKQYGVLALVSEVVAARAKGSFLFRRVDRVAVKGKTRGIDVYELIGGAGDEHPREDLARRYERAFEAYLDRRFAEAESIFAELAKDDRASEVLRDRCRQLAETPPADDWTGVHVASSK